LPGYAKVKLISQSVSGYASAPFVCQTGYGASRTGSIVVPTVPRDRAEPERAPKQTVKIVREE